MFSEMTPAAARRERCQDGNSLFYTTFRYLLFAIKGRPVPQVLPMPLWIPFYTFPWQNCLSADSSEDDSDRHQFFNPRITGAPIAFTTVEISRLFTFFIYKIAGMT